MQKDMSSGMHLRSTCLDDLSFHDVTDLDPVFAARIEVSRTDIVEKRMGVGRWRVVEALHSWKGSTLRRLNLARAEVLEAAASLHSPLSEQLDLHDQDVIQRPETGHLEFEYAIAHKLYRSVVALLVMRSHILRAEGARSLGATGPAWKLDHHNDTGSVRHDVLSSTSMWFRTVSRCHPQE